MVLKFTSNIATRNNKYRFISCRLLGCISLLFTIGIYYTCTSPVTTNTTTSQKQQQQQQQQSNNNSISEKMRSSIFVYGTLMESKVVQTLIGRIPKQQPAKIINGQYSRHPVKNYVFPGLIKSNNNNNNNNKDVIGILLSELNENEMYILDYFEGDEYTRYPCTVQLLEEDDNNKIIVETEVYLWTNPISELELNNEWSFENFRIKHLNNYLINTVQTTKNSLENN